MSEMMTLKTLARLLRVECPESVAEVAFDSVNTDTRTLKEGDLFVALKGPNFDGNHYVSEAAEKGAVAALVSNRSESDFPQLVVDDTKLALGQLASAWRDRFAGVLVGVTGSNGKTTVKEMLASILSRSGKVLATAGNFNNDIGVPLTLLRIGSEHDFAVIEMGANHPGEIGYTASLAKPDISIITNAASAHLEGFGGIEGVVKTKGEIVTKLSLEGIAVLNRDDHYFNEWQTMAGSRRIVSFGFSAAATVNSDPASIEIVEEEGRFKTSFILNYENEAIAIKLNLLGQHNVKNGLAAAAASLMAGAALEEVKAGLEAMQPVQGRLCPVKGLHGALLINDTYNANPASCSAGIDVLAAMSGEKWLVLGAFAELGEQSDELHYQIGLEAHDKGVSRLFATGEGAQQAVEAFGAGGLYYDRQEDLIEAVKKALSGEHALLIKGSRSQQMERVVEALAAANHETGGANAAVSC